MATFWNWRVASSTSSAKSHGLRNRRSVWSPMDSTSSCRSHGSTKTSRSAEGWWTRLETPFGRERTSVYRVKMEHDGFGFVEHDASFTIHVPRSAKYTVSVQAGENGGCNLYLNDDGKLVGGWGWDHLRYIGSEGLHDLVLTIPAKACDIEVSGRLVDAYGSGVPGVRLDLIRPLDRETESWASGGTTQWSGRDGLFSFSAHSSGEYLLLAYLEHCRVLWAPDGATRYHWWFSEETLRNQFVLSGEGVSRLEFRLQRENCPD